MNSHNIIQEMALHPPQRIRIMDEFMGRDMPVMFACEDIHTPAGVCRYPHLSYRVKYESVTIALAGRCVREYAGNACCLIPQFYHAYSRDLLAACADVSRTCVSFPLYRMQRVLTTQIYCHIHYNHFIADHENWCHNMSVALNIICDVMQLDADRDNHLTIGHIYHYMRAFEYNRAQADDVKCMRLHNSRSMQFLRANCSESCLKRIHERSRHIADELEYRNYCETHHFPDFATIRERVPHATHRARLAMMSVLDHFAVLDYDLDANCESQWSECELSHHTFAIPREIVIRGKRPRENAPAFYKWRKMRRIDELCDDVIA